LHPRALLGRLLQPGDVTTITGQLEADRIAFGQGARSGERYPALRAYTGPDSEERAYRAGQFFRAVAGDANAARWCGEVGHLELRAMHEGSFLAGGSLVPDLVANEVIRLVEENGIARRYARQWPMQTASISIPIRISGTTVYFVGENDPDTTSDPTVGQIQLNAKEAVAATRVSNSLLADSPVAVGDFLTAEAATAFQEKEDSCLLTATGISTYGGMRGIKFLLDDASYSGSKVAATSAHDTFAEIDAGDITRLMAALPESVRANARWFMSATAKDSILTRLALAAGGNDTQTVQQGLTRFLGYQVVTSSLLPAGASTTYNGVTIILFGDMSRTAVFGSRKGMEMVADPSIYRNYRQTYFQFVERFDCVTLGIPKSTSSIGQMVGLHGTTLERKAASRECHVGALPRDRNRARRRFNRDSPGRFTSSARRAFIPGGRPEYSRITGSRWSGGRRSVRSRVGRRPQARLSRGPRFAAIVPVLEQPGRATLIVDGREFVIVGEVDDVTQELLAD
jgi:HK97 family phage major capsid protein